MQALVFKRVRPALQDCEDRDYEPWGNGPCLLGRNYTLWRRQRASECFSGRSYKRPEPAADACPCSVVRRRSPHTSPRVCAPGLRGCRGSLRLLMRESEGERQRASVVWRSPLRWEGTL